MTGPNPTDRGKLGTKRHVLTDGEGIPLSVVITAANTHDMKAAISVLDNIVVKRPSYYMCKTKQNLCLDKGYEMVLSRKDTYHIFIIEENDLLLICPLDSIVVSRLATGRRLGHHVVIGSPRGDRWDIQQRQIL